MPLYDKKSRPEAAEPCTKAWRRNMNGNYMNNPAMGGIFDNALFRSTA